MNLYLSKFLLVLVNVVKVLFACETLAYIRLAGFQTAAKLKATLLVENENQCIDLCSSIKTCESLNFDSNLKRCDLFNEEIFQDRISNKNVTQLTKICFNSKHLSYGCRKISINLTPQKHLTSHSVAVANTSNLKECLQTCVDAMRLYGFQCFSGSFYLMESHANCMLNSASSISYPKLLDIAADKMDYFEIHCAEDYRLSARKKRELELKTPPRHRSLLWPNNLIWGSWTLCDKISGTRSRFRNCSSFNPNTCEKDSGGCDPINRAEEKQMIINEEDSTKENNLMSSTKISTVIASLTAEHQKDNEVTEPNETVEDLTSLKNDDLSNQQLDNVENHKQQNITNDQKKNPASTTCHPFIYQTPPLPARNYLGQLITYKRQNITPPQINKVTESRLQGPAYLSTPSGIDQKATKQISKTTEDVMLYLSSTQISTFESVPIIPYYPTSLSLISKSHRKLGEKLTTPLLDKSREETKPAEVENPESTQNFKFSNKRPLNSKSTTLPYKIQHENSSQNITASAKPTETESVTETATYNKTNSLNQQIINEESPAKTNVQRKTTKTVPSETHQPFANISVHETNLSTQANFQNQSSTASSLLNVTISTSLFTRTPRPKIISKADSQTLNNHRNFESAKPTPENEDLTIAGNESLSIKSESNKTEKPNEQNEKTQKSTTVRSLVNSKQLIDNNSSKNDSQVANEIVNSTNRLGIFGTEEYSSTTNTTTNENQFDQFDTIKKTETSTNKMSTSVQPKTTTLDPILTDKVLQRRILDSLS